MSPREEDPETTAAIRQAVEKVFDAMPNDAYTRERTALVADILLDLWWEARVGPAPLQPHAPGHPMGCKGCRADVEESRA